MPDRSPAPRAARAPFTSRSPIDVQSADRDRAHASAAATANDAGGHKSPTGRAFISPARVASEGAYGALVKPPSPAEEAARAARWTATPRAYGTFASSALTETRRRAEDASTPRRDGREMGAPATPMSASVKKLVTEALTALKSGRTRVEDMVKSHRGVGLNFDAAAEPEAACVSVAHAIAVPASPGTSEATMTRDDREAEREATEMLIRSAKKSLAVKSAPRSPMRSPRPMRMERVELGAPVLVLADSVATESTKVAVSRGGDADGANDEEVTSQMSLPPGFDISEYLNDAMPCTVNVSTPRETVTVENEAEENLLNNAQMDVFARMMAKVITDTLDEIASVTKSTLTEITSSANQTVEPSPPRRSSRRKSIAPSDTSARTGRSETPSTPARRSARLASKSRERK